MAEQGIRARGNTMKKMEEKLSSFATKIRDTRVLDPACGSGNFLYVALRQLLNLEKEVSAFAGTVGLTPFFPGVSPEQLHGIERNPYAHELAQVSIWIGYLQWMVDNGFGTPSEPILGPMTNIWHMDAILEIENGEAREPEWPEADVIVGNPPFLGDKKMRAELGGGYVDAVRKLYGGRVPGGADLVCYWFEKARSEIEQRRIQRAGLLATNSISLGAQAGSPVPFRDWHGRIEQRLKDSGADFTILRPNFFIQGVAALVGADGNIYAPTGDGRVGWVDVRDVADVAARTLTEERHEGKTYTITGPESLSLAEVADKLSEAAGREIRHIDVSSEAAREGMVSFGMSEWFAEALLTLFAAIRRGGLDAVTDTVSSVGRVEPRPVASYACELAPTLDESLE